MFNYLSCAKIVRPIIAMAIFNFSRNVFLTHRWINGVEIEGIVKGGKRRGIKELLSNLSYKWTTILSLWLTILNVGWPTIGG